MKQKHEYSANFKTNGNWIIPGFLGWSKSVISFSQPIGIMYTLHITPYLNIGINNPHPKQPKIDYVPTCNCLGCDGDMCSCTSDGQCQCNHDTERLDDRFVYAFFMAQEYAMTNKEMGIVGVYPDEFDEESFIVFVVLNKDVEIPNEINGYKTIKELFIQ